MGVLDRAAQRQASGETFALATVVRTVSVTAAKAGAKALIAADGAIEEGWIGGGCARAAVLKAARQCMVDGRSRLVSIAPKDLLADLGHAPGEEAEGVLYVKNSCPSQGTMDIFVEAVLPSPRLLILGASPVAVALARLAPAMGFAVTVAAQAAELGRFDTVSSRIEGLVAPPPTNAPTFVVVSTQGAGDRAALKAAAATPALYRAFVGSRRKAETLRRELAEEGVPAETLAAIKAPAGLDIHAITSEEIALSILAEMISARRGSQRPPDPSAPGGISP
jgi:xanthine dehydrogenase accessory factor